MDVSPVTAVGRPALLSHVEIGEVRVTYLPDGAIHSTPSASFPNAADELWERNQHVLDSEGLLVMSLGSFLVQSRGQNLLIDLGWGPSSFDIAELTGGESKGKIAGGQLMASLNSCGLAATDIDAVLFTHLHNDHVGWLLTDHGAGPELTFPNATHLLCERELSFWNSPAELSMATAPTADQLSAFERCAQFIEDAQTVAPGVTAWLTAGHTPGHMCYVVESAGERLVVVGDVLHCTVEIDHPELDFLYDSDPALAAATRRAVDRRLRQEKAWVAGCHFSGSAFVRL